MAVSYVRNMPSRFNSDRPRVRHPVMYQGWSQISFLHWAVDPGLLQSRLPAGLAVDTFDDTAWIGLTPFHLTGLRLRWLPSVPGLSDFPETNLRTYVRGPAGPGIWFFSLDASSSLAVLAARATFGLPYHRATMRVDVDGHRIEYRSARKRAAALIVVETGPPLPQADGRARFLTERYRLYVVSRRRLAMAPVEHAPWPLHEATLVTLNETIRAAAGLPADTTHPLVHFSPGVRARIGSLRRVGGAASGVGGLEKGVD